MWKFTIEVLVGAVGLTGVVIWWFFLDQSRRLDAKLEKQYSELFGAAEPRDRFAIERRLEFAETLDFLKTLRLHVAVALFVLLLLPIILVLLLRSSNKPNVVVRGGSSPSSLVVSGTSSHDNKWVRSIGQLALEASSQAAISDVQGEALAMRAGSQFVDGFAKEGGKQSAKLIGSLVGKLFPDGSVRVMYVEDRLPSPNPIVLGRNTLNDSQLIRSIGQLALDASRHAATSGAQGETLAIRAGSHFVNGFAKEGGQQTAKLIGSLVGKLFPDGSVKVMYVDEGRLHKKDVGFVAPLTKSESFYVPFTHSSARLTHKANYVVGLARNYARGHRGTVLLLSANTDTTGSSSYNSRLAWERAMAVRRRLITEGGIAPGRIFVDALATHSLPVVTGANKRNGKNRRVTIAVQY